MPDFATDPRCKYTVTNEWHVCKLEDYSGAPVYLGTVTAETEVEAKTKAAEQFREFEFLRRVIDREVKR